MTTARDNPTGRRLCAHADHDGAGMHIVAPGEVCSRLQLVPPAAEQAAPDGAECAICGRTDDLIVVAVRGGTFVCRSAMRCMGDFR